MPRASTRFALVLATVLAGLVEGAKAYALEGALDVNLRGLAREAPLEVTQAQLLAETSTLTDSREALQLHLFGFVRHRPIPELGLRLGLDTGLLELRAVDGSAELLADGIELGERFVETLFLGETYLDLQLGENGVVQTRWGKLRPRIGGGAIFDAYALGGMLDVDLQLTNPKLPLSFRAHLFYPDARFEDSGKLSPFADLELALRWGARNELRLLLAGLWDGDQGATPVLVDAFARGGEDRFAAARESLPSSVFVDAALDRVQRQLRELRGSGVLYALETEGWLGWTGVSLRLHEGPLTLEGVLLLGFGRLHLVSRATDELRALVEGSAALAGRADELLGLFDDEGDVDLLSAFGQLRARVELLEDLDLRAFFLGMSGDDGLYPDESGSYGAFISLAPYLPHTSFFFGGALAPAASVTVASPAPDGAGLIAGGTFFEARVGRGFRFESGIAAMASVEPAPLTGGSFHGIEGNLLADAVLLDGISLHVDLAAFVPGDYYATRAIAVQALLGASARWGPRAFEF